MNENTGELFEKMIQQAAESKKQSELPSEELTRVISRNVELLHKFPSMGTADSLREGIWHGEAMWDPNDRSITIEGIRITYNGRTGEIAYPDGQDYKDENFRILRTWFLTKEQKADTDPAGSDQASTADKKYYAVQTSYARDVLTPEQVAEAIQQLDLEKNEADQEVEPVSVPSSDLKIQSERVFPEHDWLQLQSLYVQPTEFSPGDAAFFQSLEEFNKKYWLPLEAELFQKLARKRW